MSSYKMSRVNGTMHVAFNSLEKLKKGHKANVHFEIEPKKREKSV